MICDYILRHLNELRRRNKFCDLQLLTKEGETFSLHKCVFVAACKRQFDIACSTENLCMPKISKMVLHDVTSSEMELLIRFIYGENMSHEHSMLERALSKLHMFNLLKEADTNKSLQGKDSQVCPQWRTPDIHEMHGGPKYYTENMPASNNETETSQMTICSIKEEPESPTESVEVHKLQAKGADNVNSLTNWNCENHDKADIKTDINEACEITLFKQECEELANTDTNLIEVKTEEDKRIDELMDQISDELELLKSPDPVQNSVCAEDTSETDIIEKEKSQLQPESYDLKTTDANLHLATDSVKEQLRSEISKCSTSITESLASVICTTGASRLFSSSQKQTTNKATVPSKYKVILPRGSQSPEFVAKSYLLSSGESNLKFEPDTNISATRSSSEMTTDCPSTCLGCQSSVNESFHTASSISTGTGAAVQCKTIATLLALPPLMSSSAEDSKKTFPSKCTEISHSNEMKCKRIKVKPHTLNTNSKDNIKVKRDSFENQHICINERKNINGKDKQLTSDKIMPLPYVPGMSLKSLVEDKNLEAVTNSHTSKKIKIQRLAPSSKQQQAIRLKRYIKMKGKKNAAVNILRTHTCSPATVQSDPAIAVRDVKTDVFFSTKQMVEESVCTTSSDNRIIRAVAEPEADDVGKDNRAKTFRSLTLSEQIKLQRNKKGRRKFMTSFKRLSTEHYGEPELSSQDLEITEVSSVEIIKSGKPTTSAISCVTQSPSKNASKIIESSENLIICSPSSLKAETKDGQLAMFRKGFNVESKTDKMAEDICLITTDNLFTPENQLTLQSAPVDDEKKIQIRHPEAKSGDNLITQVSQGKSNVESVSEKSPEIVKLLARSVRSFPLSVPRIAESADVPECADSISRMKTESSEAVLKSLSVMHNIVSKDNQNKQNTYITMSENMNKTAESVILSTETEKEKQIIKADMKSSESPSDLDKTDRKKPRKTGSPIKSCLSVKQLLHIKPKIYNKSNMEIGSGCFDKSSEHSVFKSRKRHLSLPQICDLACLKKSKNIEMKTKFKPKMRTGTGFDQTLGRENICGNILNSNNGESVRVCATSSHQMSAGMIKGDEEKSTTDTNSIVMPQNAETNQIGIAPKQTMIVMAPCEPKTVHGYMKCYEKPLFLPEQMLPNHESSSAQKDSLPVRDSLPVKNSLPVKKNILAIKPVPFRAYRPIAPKKSEDKSPDHSEKKV